MSKSELVIIAPTQIKKKLGIGNIYDLTLADFYTKAKRFNNTKIHMPFLWNVNGKHLLKQMKLEQMPLTSNSIIQCASTFIENAKTQLIKHHLNFDDFLRDDENSAKIDVLAKTLYKTAFVEGKTQVNECLKCGEIYGSDPTIKICKNCNEPTSYYVKETLYKKIKRGELEEKIQSIKFIPEDIQLKLNAFLNQMPNEYDLILEKKRTYSLKYKNYCLDPKFVAMLFPAILNNDLLNNSFSMKTFIHGDVIKKFDYYSLCYLNMQDIPTKIIAHKILVGEDKKKLRWQNDDNGFNLDAWDTKILRAYFLQHNINKDVVVSQKQLEQHKIGLTRTYIKINKILENRNLDTGKFGVRPKLQALINEFNVAIDSFKLSKAFYSVKEYIDLSWKLVKENKLSFDEHNTLISFKQMYFGA
ncbi:MAG: hypothetical protein PHU51_05955 [Candidatus Nanoarchaeia archaeon]|nr:hypothetical protein [Candidatus Nanoarchaeia archaeon]